MPRRHPRDAPLGVGDDVGEALARDGDDARRLVAVVRLVPRLVVEEVQAAYRAHTRGNATLADGMAATLETLVDEIERNYTETQERLSDPAVYNDRREAADVGRRLKELEGPHRLALEWRAAREDLAAAREDSDLRELVPELEERTARLEQELRLAMAPTEPPDLKDLIPP